MFPIKLSTPYVSKVSDNIPILAPPEIELIIPSGTTSEGIFIRLVIGEIIFINRSIAPLTLNKLIAIYIPIIVGKILNIIFNPSFAPSIKSS